MGRSDLQLVVRDPDDTIIGRATVPVVIRARAEANTICLNTEP